MTETLVRYKIYDAEGKPIKSEFKRCGNLDECPNQTTNSLPASQGGMGKKGGSNSVSNPEHGGTCASISLFRAFSGAPLLALAALIAC